MNSYIAHGLAALARNAELKGKSWFIGHIGAAVMAGGFLLDNQRISRGGRDLLQRRLDKVIRDNAPHFEPYVKAPVIALDPLVEAIEQNCMKLCMSGHGVIYGTLALRALRVCPALATEALVNGILPTLDATQQDDPARYYGVSDFREFQPTQIDNDLETAVKRAYRMSCENLADNQAISGRYYFFAGEKLHGITHSQALFDLHQMGYRELANMGLANLNKQLALNEMQPQGLGRTAGRELNILDESFWSHEFEDLHSIKLAYSALELNRVFGDEAIPLAKLAPHWGFMR